MPVHNNQLQPSQATDRKKTHRGRRKPRALRRTEAQNVQRGATGLAPDGLKPLGATGTPGTPQAAAGPPTSAVHASLPRSNQGIHPETVVSSDLPTVAPGGNGGQVEEKATGQVNTALFDEKRHMRWDAKQARRAALEDWRPDRRVVKAAVTKVSQAVLTGEMDGQKLTPPMTLKGVELLHGFDRLITADQHHDDRLDYHDRALDSRNSGSGTIAGLQLTNDGAGKSSVVVYIPDNGRSMPLDDDLRPEDLLRD